MSQDGNKSSSSFGNTRYQPWLKSQGTAQTYHVSGSPVGYSSTLDVSNNALRGSHNIMQASAFGPPKRESVSSPLCSAPDN